MHNSHRTSRVERSGSFLAFPLLGGCKNVHEPGQYGETILVVEDAEAIRKMVCTMLAQSGYVCLEASDGSEALQVLDSESVHLVLTDMIMPNMTGAELAQHISRSRPDIRIVFMSGFTEDPIVQSVQHSPIFLAKPFTQDRLAAKVREVLDGGRPAHLREIR